jgi:hypothetical protein
MTSFFKIGLFNTVFYFFLLLLSSFSLHAEEQETTEAVSIEQSKPEKKQYYIVEIVLFQHLNKQGRRDEFWNRPDFFDSSLETNNLSNNSKNFTDDSPALAEYDLQNKSFSPLRNGIAKLSSENYKLSDSAAHLRYSPNYKLLAHFGWTQRSLSKKRALPVRITPSQFSGGLMPAGDLTLYVSRFLHMKVDIQASQCDYTPEKNNEETSDKQCSDNVYLFSQNRKMRSRELHYIDNPVFGMLVYVTPFTI